MEKYYKIGEISKLYNIGVDSLRYYEEIGLITPKRAKSKYRLYSVKDIWRLNVIRELRELGFSMSQIKDYLDHHNTSSTLNILNEEELLIEKKIKELKELKKNVNARINSIISSYKEPLDTIQIKEYPLRRCYLRNESYTDGEEMDVLIKKLINIDKDKFYIIGSKQIGSIIKVKDLVKSNYQKNFYSSVFIIDEKGDSKLEKGRYLSITYQGDYNKSKDYIKKLVLYAKENNLKISDEFLEILWIDIHTSSILEEHITELQVLIND